METANVEAKRGDLGSLLESLNVQEVEKDGGSRESPLVHRDEPLAANDKQHKTTHANVGEALVAEDNQTTHTNVGEALGTENKTLVELPHAALAPQHVLHAQSGVEEKELRRGGGSNGTSAIKSRRHEPKEEADEALLQEGNVLLTGLEGLSEVLTKAPTDKAVLKEAVGMIAPLSALSLCRYKVKLTPGSCSRSTVIKDARKEFMRIAGAPLGKALKGAGNRGHKGASSAGKTFAKSVHGAGWAEGPDSAARQREVALLAALTDDLLLAHILGDARVVPVKPPRKVS